MRFAHAGLACVATVTGSEKENVEPRPNRELDPDASAVHLDDALRDREAEAGAALLGDGVVGLLEFLEHLGLIGLGNARARCRAPTD